MLCAVRCAVCAKTLKSVKNRIKRTQKRLKNGVVLKKTITPDDLAALACEESAERSEQKGVGGFSRFFQNREKPLKTELKLSQKRGQTVL